MPTAGKAWYHIIINARGSWLPGDPRGFHSRNHRKHSDGDYKAPPPPGQHEGLHRLIQSSSRQPVHFPRMLWPHIGISILEKIRKQEHRVLAISVDEHHVHLLVELLDDRPAVKQTVGRWKQHASHAVRNTLPGEIWSKSCDPVRIADRSHHERVFQYILDHRAEGAWVWSFQDET